MEHVRSRLKADKVSNSINLLASRIRRISLLKGEICKHTANKGEQETSIST